PYHGSPPMSVPFTVIRFVLRTRATVGVQGNTPALGSTFCPYGTLSRPKVKELAGRSASLAVFVTVSVLSSGTVRSVGTVSTGALLASLTSTVKLLLSLDGGMPLSVTFTVFTLVIGRCSSVGVHVNTPSL